MIKQLLAALAFSFAFAANAAVDLNKATPAELDGIKGIGPSVSARILDERKKSPFKDWSDFVARVKGVGEGTAARYSAEGLTINGEGFKKAAAAKKEDKTVSAKKDEKAATAKK